MKMDKLKLAVATASVAVVTACTTTTSGTVFGNSQKVNFVGNPASAYCMNVGGSLTLESDTNGHNKVGMCHLPNGDVVEQWTYYQNSMYLEEVEEAVVEAVE